MCIQTGKTLTDENRMRMNTDQLYVKSEDGDARRASRNFAGRHRAHRAKSRSAARWSSTFRKTYLPEFPAARGRDERRLSAQACARRALGQALRARPRRTRSERMEYELGVIIRHGLCGLLPDRLGFHPLRQARHGVRRRARARQRRGLHRAPMRWASPSIDPLKYDLLFERFLNPERISMPDIDVRLLTTSAAGR